MRSALVNNSTNIVENICMAEPVSPSPYDGLYMVGLQDNVFDDEGNLVSAATPCDIGWVYDPVTEIFSNPQG